jgi:hypothetical protein
MTTMSGTVDASQSHPLPDNWSDGCSDCLMRSRPNTESLVRVEQLQGAHLRDGLVLNLPAGFAGATFHPPVAPARAVPNLQDGPERAGSVAAANSHCGKWQLVFGSSGSSRTRSATGS